MEVERPPWASLHLAQGAWECGGRRVKGGWSVKGHARCGCAEHDTFVL